METWMMYDLWASIVIGIGGFLQKIETERKLSKNSFLVYTHLWIIIGSLLYILISGGTIVFDWRIILPALWISTIYVIVFKYRLKSLDYLSSSSYFINYRIFSSILLLIFGQILYQENISINEYIWIVLWFIIFYLLIEKKDKSETISQMWKWYMYLWVWVIGISLIWVLQKQFVLLQLDFASYIFFSWVNATLLPLLLKSKNESFRDIFYIKETPDKLLLLCSGLLAPFGLLFNVLAVDAGGDMWIVYKIVSYSLFIPIILSVIFYKEKITFKKLLAFVLTVASIWLFI